MWYERISESPISDDVVNGVIKTWITVSEVSSPLDKLSEGMTTGWNLAVAPSVLTGDGFSV